MSTTHGETTGKAPEATVIVCVYNRPDQIRTCLAGLRALEGNDFEILVVDDASTDHTPDVVRQISAEHAKPPVRMVRCPENRGVSGARNFGIDHALGRFVVFTDSDCVPEARWLEQLLGPLRAGRADAVSGAVVDSPPRNLAERASWGTTTIGRHSWQARRLVGCNMGFRRELVARYRFDEALEYYCDEDELAARMNARGVPIEFVADAVVYHDHPYTMRSYLNHAWKIGQGVARFGYKHGFYVNRDLWALFAAILTMPLVAFGRPVAFVPAAFLLLQIGAVLFAEVVFKGKRLGEGMVVLAPALAHNLVKGASVVLTLARIIVFRAEPRIIEARETWRQHGDRSRP